MSQQIRNVLKAYFETGDIPTEAEFINLIDSLVNVLDDKVSPWASTIIDYTAFALDASLNATKSIVNIPAGSQPLNFMLRVNEAFAAPGLVSLDTILGPTVGAGNYTALNLDLTVANAVSGGRYAPATLSSDLGLLSILGSEIVLAFTISGAPAIFLDALTAGNITVFYQLIKLD